MYKLIAHRGDKESSKENTMAAFFDAINKDYVGFECDVRQSKEGDFFIYHDVLYQGKIFRKMNSNTLIKNKVPKLTNVLMINTSKIILLDIKDPLINTDNLIKILNKYSTKNIYVMSFYDNVINKLLIKDRKYKIGILNYILNTQDNHFNYDFICLLQIFASTKMIDKFRQQKKEVFIYGVKNEQINNYFPYYIVD